MLRASGRGFDSRRLHLCCRKSFYGYKRKLSDYYQHRFNRAPITRPSAFILIAAGITPGTVEIDQMAMAAAEQARADQTAKSRTRARSLWDYGDTIQGSKGETYLRGRGITCALPESLRWLPDTYHGPSGSYGGA